MKKEPVRLGFIQRNIEKTLPEITNKDIAEYINEKYEKYNIDNLSSAHLFVISFKDAQKIVKHFTGKSLKSKEALKKHLYLRFPYRGAFYCKIYPCKVREAKIENYNPNAVFSIITNTYGYVDLAEYENRFCKECKMEDYAGYLERTYRVVEIDLEKFEKGFHRKTEIKEVPEAKSNLSLGKGQDEHNLN